MIGITIDKMTVGQSAAGLEVRGERLEVRKKLCNL